MKPVRAIINVRVSTSEQLKNNSLSRQMEAVEKAAAKLGATIPADGRWSGSVSSKAGTNVKRKDLLEMLAYCKRDKSVRFAIFDEYDRFMRSSLEGPYYEVMFQQLGVKVWFASESDTFNGDDAMAKLMRSLNAFKAEGSNEERQRKSVSGHEKALREGRYTFPPKAGYMKGIKPGIHQPHPVTHLPLKKAMEEVAGGMYTPQEALQRLNDSAFGTEHARWKMDKFRRACTDPYYAGIVEKSKQVKARSENGLHQAMISKETHFELVRIFSHRTKLRGPKKQYNPEFPMNKLLTCGDCGSDVKFTGSKKHNGFAKKTPRYYYKYHCRGCGRSYHRSAVHAAINERLTALTYDNTQRKELIAALCTVWETKQHDKLLDIQQKKNSLSMLEDMKSKLIREMISADDSLKTDIRGELGKVKTQIEELEYGITDDSMLGEDLLEFVLFSLEYTNELKDDWWNLDHEERVRCQQLIFPGGISFNSAKIVGTPEISPIYTLQANKKALRVDRKALMVELVGTAPTSAGLSLAYRLQV